MDGGPANWVDGKESNNILNALEGNGRNEYGQITQVMRRRRKPHVVALLTDLGSPTLAKKPVCTPYTIPSPANDELIHLEVLVPGGPWLANTADFGLSRHQKSGSHPSARAAASIALRNLNASTG